MRQGRKISVYGITHDDAGRLLLVRGSAESNFPGRWNLPGGGIEHAESPTDALIREFGEETGLSIRVGALADVRSDLVRNEARDRLIHFDRIVYDVEVTGGQLRNEVDGSTDGVRWFAPEEVSGAPPMPWLARFLGDPTAPEVDAAAAALAVPHSRDPNAVRFQRFSAYGVVRDPSGRLLLTRVSAGYPGAGHWHLPGGGTDFGESARDALVREIREETGQQAVVGPLLDVVDMHNPNAYGPERRPLDWHTVRAIFDVEVPHPTEPSVQEVGGSTDRVAWFTVAEAAQLNLNRLTLTILADHVR